MKQNKSRKQTLESAQYGLEISSHWHYEEIVQKRNGKRIFLLKTFMKLSVRGFFPSLRVS